MLDVERLGELGRKPVFIVLTLFVLFVLSALVTFVALRSRIQPQGQRGSSDYRPTAIDVKSPVYVPGPLTLSDFILVDEEDPLERPSFYYHREDRERCTEQEVEQYWISVKDIAIDILARQNDRNAENLFR